MFNEPYNIVSKVFANKLEYLMFKEAWKEAVNSPRAKPYNHKYTTKSWRDGSTIEVCERRPGWITSSHVLFYAFVRGKDLRTIFPPVTNPTRLRNGAILNHGLYEAYRYLSFLVDRYSCAIKDPKHNQFSMSYRQYYNDWMKGFVKPFNGTLTGEHLQLALEEIPEIKPIRSNFGRGEIAANKLIKEAPTNPIHAWQIIEEEMGKT